MLFLILTYIFPLMTMGIGYTIIATVLWGSKQIGESTQAQMNLISSKQKVVRMLICGKFFRLKLLWKKIDLQKQKCFLILIISQKKQEFCFC